MKIIRVDPINRYQRRLFLELPYQLYKHVPQWVPPLAMDARKIFDRHHPFYMAGEAIFILALDESNCPVGRIAVLHNPTYNTYNQENAAFFYLFECINSQQVANALLDEAINWARSRGLHRMIGPKGFTVLDGLGMLVEGFDRRPALGLPYNPPYYPNLIEAAGFNGCDDLLSGYLNCQELIMPDKVQRAAELVQKRRGFKVIQFKNRRDFIKIIPHF